LPCCTTAILPLHAALPICYDVDTAPGGVEALPAIRRTHYDLVLTDLKMPKVDGLAVLEEVRKVSPHSATIMLTGYGSLDSAVERSEEHTSELQSPDHIVCR